MDICLSSTDADEVVQVNLPGLALGVVKPVGSAAWTSVGGLPCLNATHLKYASTNPMSRSTIAHATL